MSTTRRLTTHRDRRRPTLLHSFAGLALAALLAGCGGGGGPMTSAPPDSTDPTDTGKPTDNERPTHVVQPTASTSAIEFTNTTAADLRDHWHAPAPVTDALGLEPVTDATNAATLTRIRARLTDADPAIAADWHAALAAGRATVLGTRDGYVVAKAAGGPAGHLDIRFDYAQAPAASAANRILLERAAKDWSRRIRDPFAGPPPATGPRSVEEVRVGRRDIDLLPNAMLIEVTMTDELVSRGGQIYIFTSPDDVKM